MKANVSVRPFLLLTVVFAAFTIACSKDPEVAKREYVRSGDAYVAKKQYKEAVIEYRNAVQPSLKYKRSTNSRESWSLARASFT